MKLLVLGAGFLNAGVLGATLFALTGALAGALQSRSLGGSLGRAHSPLGAFLRLLGAAAVLFLAAKQGHIIAGAAGWAGGFLVGCLWIYRRLR